MDQTKGQTRCSLINYLMDLRLHGGAADGRWCGDDWSGSQTPQAINVDIDGDCDMRFLGFSNPTAINQRQ